MMLTLGLLVNTDTASSNVKMLQSSAAVHNPKHKTNKSGEKDGENTPAVKPCTVTNPLTNQFYDLRSLAAVTKDIDGQTVIVSQPWMTRGLDYAGNFTLGICSSPISLPEDLDGDDFSSVRNKTEVAAYFTSPDFPHKMALGLASTELKFRGRNLVMEYTGGDLCPNSKTRRRSSLLLFSCDREIQSKAKVSYIGSADDCAYFFEVRTIHACATAPTGENMGIVSIVFLIGAAAAITFFGGGVLYKLFKRLDLGQPPRLPN
ncbi:hypothetical protein FOA43_003895 [Brettanomyces nanus]|uniref:MRH domain-containing protein n=1 Tax=Eeniella nana TaxID=13502 RepID=A0A875S5C7_EENNA|nr:uncharacterized protein FOA43_003895 [Brettanomyces nanus]QPG76506.1 hypothetical protein FOA43_003895 [Brettanomyces nanus]